MTTLKKSERIEKHEKIFKILFKILKLKITGHTHYDGILYLRTRKQ